MLSLKNILNKFPSHWSNNFQPITIDTSEFLDLYLNLGICKDENSFFVQSNAMRIKLLQSQIPNLKKEDCLTACHIIISTLFFDDLLDKTVGDKEFATKIQNNFVNIFKYQDNPETDKLENDVHAEDLISLPFERLETFGFKQVVKRCGKRRLLLNLFKSAAINYFQSVIPFNQLRKFDELPDLELYYLMRIKNMGKCPIFFMGIIFTTQVLDAEMFIDPLWVDLLDTIGVISGLSNDIVSYDKEINEGTEKINAFHFIQVSGKMSKSECLDFFEKEFDRWFEKFNNLEKEIISKYEKTFSTKEELDEFHIAINLARSIVAGYMKWIITFKRYTTPNPTFIELKSI